MVNEKVLAAKEKLINEIKNGKILLDAEKNDCDYFELTSGKHVREFITIWGLPHDVELFCNAALIEKIQALKKTTGRGFTKIVTSTKTVKEFSKGLIRELNNKIRHPEDYDSLNDVFYPIYFGDYPSLEENYKVRFFDGEKVIILTDVISTGTLVQNLVEIVNRSGAQVIEVICLVAANEAIIKDRSIQVTLFEKNIKIPVDFLLEYPIEHHHEIAASSRIKKINPITVLPFDKPVFPNNIEPVFNTSQAFAHFGITSSVAYGLFNFSSRSFTTAFKIEDLLEADDDVGNEIWSNIRETVLSCDRIITTYLDEDKIFLRFISAKLALEKSQNIPSIVIIKRDTRDDPFLYFTLLDEERTGIEGRNVLLLFSTLSTSEKLRNISALITSFKKPVKSITALCLINRMGLYNTSFLTRISNISHNKKAGFLSTNQLSSNDRIAFNFQALYNIADFSAFDLEVMQSVLEKSISNYKKFTRVEYFSDIADEHSAEYFQATEMASMDIFESEPHEEEVENKRYSFKMADGKNISLEFGNNRTCLSFITNYTAITKNYNHVIDMFSVQTTNHALFHLFRLCVCEINMLRSTGQITILKKIIISRIRKLRTERKNLEKDLPDDLDYSFKLKIDTEFALLAILCYLFILDSSDNVIPQESVVDLIFSKDEFSDWNDYPINFKFYFETQKPIPFYCLSILAFSFKDKKSKRFESFKEKIKHELSEIEHQLNKLQKTANRKADEMRVAGRNIPVFSREIISNNITFLQAELGMAEMRDFHEIIRLLQEELIEKKMSHIEILLNLTYLKDALETIKKLEPGNFIHRLREEDVGKLNTAISFLYKLKDISKYIRAFFSVHRGNPDECKYYLAPEDRIGLSRNIAKFIQLLQTIKSNASFDNREYDNFLTAFDKVITQHVFNYRNILFKSLFEYVISAYDLTNRILTDVIRHEQFNNYPNMQKALEAAGNIFAGKYKRADNEGDFYFFYDESSARAILRNVITNLRHSDNILTGIDAISIDFENNIARQELKFMLKWSTVKEIASDDFKKPYTTLLNQVKHVKTYGGNFILISNRSKDGSFENTIELQFVKLDPVYKKQVETFNKENNIV